MYMYMVFIVLTCVLIHVHVHVYCETYKKDKYGIYRKVLKSFYVARSGWAGWYVEMSMFFQSIIY